MKTKTRRVSNRRLRSRTKRTRARTKRKRRVKTLKGGYCAPCALPVMKAGLATAGIAMGTLFSISSVSKKNPKGLFMKTIMKRVSNGTTNKLVIKLVKGKGKARLFKGKKEIKIKGDPEKQYRSLIQRCKDKGFKKC